MDDIDFSALAAVAEQYGPYLFAIVFVLGLTVVAQRAYAGARDEEQAKTFRRYFFISFYFGIGLVIFCVVAWTYDRELPHKYVYTVEIRNVPASRGFWSTDPNACVLSDVSSVAGLPVQRFKAFFVRSQHLQQGAGLPITEGPAAGLGPAPTPGDIESVTLPVAASTTVLDYSNLRHPVANPVQTAER